MAETNIESAAWASEDDAAAFQRDVLMFGTAYSTIAADGLRRYLSLTDVRFDDGDWQSPATPFV